MGQSGPGDQPPPPSGSQTPPQGWQSTPQQPAPPPPAGGTGPAGGGYSSTALPAGPIAGTTVADFISRLVAFVIDGFVIWLANFIVSAILFPLLVVALGGLYVVVQAVASVAISAGYFIYFWTNRRQTPGMMLMKLLVVEDGTGATLTQEKAIRRWLYLGFPLALSALLYAGSGGFGGFGVVGFGGLAILFTLATVVAVVSIVWQVYLAYTTYQDPRKQGAHDKAVNSVVVSYGPSPFSQQAPR